MTRHNWQDGLEIDASTGFPRWQGELLNLQYALDGLRPSRPDEPEQDGYLLQFEVP